MPAQRKPMLECNLPVAILREKNRFAAYTPVLELSSSGRTQAEAQERLVEAVTLFFEELIENKTLDDVLGDLGWEKGKRGWRPPSVVSQRSEKICVSHVVSYK